MSGRGSMPRASRCTATPAGAEPGGQIPAPAAPRARRSSSAPSAAARRTPALSWRRTVTTPCGPRGGFSVLALRNSWSAPRAAPHATPLRDRRSPRSRPAVRAREQHRRDLRVGNGHPRRPGLYQIAGDRRRLSQQPLQPGDIEHDAATRPPLDARREIVRDCHEPIAPRAPCSAAYSSHGGTGTTEPAARPSVPAAAGPWPPTSALPQARHPESRASDHRTRGCA